jgi:hypothetical protein
MYIYIYIYIYVYIYIYAHTDPYLCMCTFTYECINIYIVIHSNITHIHQDVEKSLPPKEEIIIEVALTSIQKQFYRAVYEKNTSYLFKGIRPSNQPSLMNVMMELRKCCNHPYLLRGVEERICQDIPFEDQHDIGMYNFISIFILYIDIFIFVYISVSI